MNIERPLLSFCIPTYNRADIIINTLTHLLSFNLNTIEVVVSDNCSVDNTEDRIMQLRDERLKYYKNEKNYGGIFNIIKVMELATGEYVFLLSDEDSVNLGIIHSLLNLIKENNNASIILGSICNQDGLFKMQHDNRTIKKGKESFWEIGFSHYYMSGIVFKKDLLDFNYYFMEWNKETHGLIDTYPHVFILNLLCYLGDVVTFKDTFVSQREIGEDNTVNLHGTKYVEPLSRLIQFKKNVTFIKLLNDDNDYKMQYVFKLLDQHLNSIINYENIINNKEMRSYYGIDKVRFNVHDYFINLKLELKEILHDFCTDIDELDNYILKANRRIDTFYYYSRAHQLYFNTLKLYKTPFHRVCKYIWKATKSILTRDN